MKKLFLALLSIPLLVTGCNSSNTPVDPEPEEEFETHVISHITNNGELGSFNLTSPENGFSTNKGFTFTWEASTNADYYALEIASTLNFISDDEDEVYVRESNISKNMFELNYVLPKKDINYYWRVTAINAAHSKKCNDVGNFFYESIKVGEIKIEIEDEQDWALHKEGSYADIIVDRNDFFGTGENSLAIVFDKEHTCQGVPKSDGWIVITKTEDRELYGTDAFYFNFYYSGHDASVLIRVLDYDGEYWHNQVQISNNAKQTIIMKYEDFSLRTAGTNVYNRRFDWEHIRYFEIVFERTFGDGICILSDIKAVKYENYKHMFMDKMDFRSSDMSTWTYENFNFDKEVSEDGNELTLSYKARNEETNPNGFTGYGFQNVEVNRFFATGDALRMKVKYTGSSSTANFFFRILEEDNDRWQFKTPFSYLIKDDYKELILPLKAFQRMEYMNGDGAKQFYYIKRFNIGLSDNYATGTITIKDLEIIKLDDVLESRKRVVSENGMIENFENYDIYTQIYYYWDQSFVNKDESMKLDSIHKTGDLTNKYCGEFDYKADMEMAVYQIYLDSSAVAGKNAFSLWLKDAAKKPEDPMVAYLQDNEIAGEMTIQLTMDSGEWYRYVIPSMPRQWQQYTIKFDDFELNNESDLFDEPNPLSSEHIIHMAFGFKYFYYDATGKAHPTYAIANPVYLDEIKFTTAAESSIEDIGNEIKEDTDNPNRITVEDMEKYSSDEELFNYWSYGADRSYNSISISNEVSSEGGTKSMKMHYKGYESVSYIRNTEFASTITAKGVSLDIKGDGKATVYVNLNWRLGTTLYKMRYAISNIPTDWTRYEIGLTMFKDVNGSNKTMVQADARNIESISFGIVNSGTSESDIFVDNIRLRKDLGYEDEKKTSIL